MPLFIQGGFVTSQVVSSSKTMLQLKFDQNTIVEGHYVKKKKVSDTHADIMQVATPLEQNLQNSPKNLLVSGSGVGLGRGDVIGNPQNAIITTSSIGGDKYNVASALSPFKHCIISTNPNFEFNNFVTNF